MLEQIHHDRTAATRMPRAGRRGGRGAAPIRRRQSTAKFGRIYPYEIDAFGNSYCIDDGNVPSLLSLPYLDAVEAQRPALSATRRLCVVFDSNPYYCKGKAAEGPGGPHVGMDMIWPLGLIMHGLTSTDDKEIRALPGDAATDPRRHRLHARGLSTRTTRRNSPAPGLPGPTPSSANWS